MREYELTDDEYRTIMDALKYAYEHAVHSEAQAKFHNAQMKLMRQLEEVEHE